MITVSISEDILEPNYRSLAFETFVFPGGECHVQLGEINNPELVQSILIKAPLQNSNDIFTFFLLCDVLRYKFVWANIEVVIPYLPYARQDRNTTSNSPFSLKVFLQTLASVTESRIDKITIWDPHSNIAEVLMSDSNVTFVPQWELLEKFDLVKLACNNATLIAPDVGSIKKIEKIASMWSRPFIFANKVRDSSTGKITHIEVYGEGLPERVFIIDDICDGGATFVELAKVLKSKGAKYVGLYVTHGIFSKGFEVFNGLIDEIYTTQSFPQPWMYSPPSNVYVNPSVI